MVQHFSSLEAAEKGAKNVQEYLDEQGMYLQVQVEVVGEDDYVVAIVNCF